MNGTPSPSDLTAIGAVFFALRILESFARTLADRYRAGPSSVAKQAANGNGKLLAQMLDRHDRDIARLRRDRREDRRYFQHQIDDLKSRFDRLAGLKA